jgi:ABC-type Fe3+-hydroxamate transport system substrate-binding protein
MKKRIHPNLLITLIIILAGVPAYFFGRGTPVEEQNAEKAHREIIEVIDQLNRKVAVSVPVQRIISLNPVFEESLGFIGAQDLLIASTSVSAEALNIPVIQFPEKPDPKEIKALNPDLILISSEYPNVVKILEQDMHVKEISVLAFNPEDLESSIELAELLGEITGRGAGKWKEKLLKKTE